MSLKSIVGVMLATAIAYASVFVLLLIMNFISFQNADPEQFLGVFAYAAFFLGAILSGFLNARNNGEVNGITAGIVAGLVYAGFIFLISLLIKGERGFIERLIINLIAVALAAAGGYIGAYKHPKKISPAKTRDAVRKKYLSKRA